MGHKGVNEKTVFVVTLRVKIIDKTTFLYRVLMNKSYLELFMNLRERTKKGQSMQKRIPVCSDPCYMPAAGYKPASYTFLRIKSRMIECRRFIKSKHEIRALNSVA
jgi:hypothetical protein